MNTPNNRVRYAGGAGGTPHKTGFWSRIWCAAALLTAALTAATPAAAAPELSEITVYSSLDVQAPVQLITAQREGFFKQFGLNVNIKYYQSATDIVPGMIGGSTVLGHGGALNPLLVADQGFPVKVIAMVADYQRSSQLVVSKGVANMSPADLAGKTLVGPDVPVMRMFWNNWAAANKIDPKSVKWLNAAPSDALVAFNSGRADMLLLWAPHTTNAIQAGGVLWQDGRSSFRSGKAEESQVYRNWGVVFGSADWIAKNPRTVQAYLSGLYLAQAYLDCNPDQVAKLVSAENRIDPVLGGAMMKLNTYQVALSPSFMGDIQGWTDTFRQFGLLKKPLVARDIVEPSIMDGVIKATPLPASLTCKK